MITNFICELSKRGSPCLWEYGGAASNTGRAMIIADRKGQPKKAIYVARGGHLSNGNHALIPVEANDVIVMAVHHRGDFRIQVFKAGRILKRSECDYSGQIVPAEDRDGPRCPICAGYLDYHTGFHPHANEIYQDYDATILLASLQVEFSKGEWDEDPLPEWKDAIEAAKKKAQMYHCRSAVYIKET